jgi:hypothetical protein
MIPAWMRQPGGSAAATNAVGGMFGRGAQKVLGRTLSGVKNQALQKLDNLGVPLTIGQIGHGSDNVLGKAVGGIEDRAAGLPIFDAIINSARRRGEQGFNRAAFREMGGSGATGAQGVTEGRQIVNNAYDFLNSASFPADKDLQEQLAAVRSSLPPTNFGEGVRSRLSQIDDALKLGSLSGRDWQSAIRGIRADRTSLRGQPFSDRAVGTLDDLEQALTNFAERQGAPGVASNLARANGVNKQFNTITAALDNAPTQSRGELFSANRLNTASLANARKFGGRTAAVAGDRPFYDLTTAGMDVMPNQVPDSGTAGRALLYSTLFGGGVGGGIGAAVDQNDRAEGGLTGSKVGVSVPFAVAALYSKSGQKLLQKALLGDRPEQIARLGDFLL